MTDEPAAPVSVTKNGVKIGRPRKLNADEATLKQLTGLGRLQATVRECAAFFGVALMTFETFLNEPGVREAFEDGKGAGKIGLRRTQIRLAEKAPAMAIFLGKNWLGQSDKHDLQHTGAGGGPIQYVDLTTVSDDDLRRLDSLLGTALLTDGSSPGAGGEDQGGDRPEG